MQFLSSNPALWQVRPSDIQNRVSADFPLASPVKYNANSIHHRRSKGFCESFIDMESKNKAYFGGSFFKQSSQPQKKPRLPSQPSQPRQSMHYSKTQQLPIKKLQSLHGQRFDFYNAMCDAVNGKLQRASRPRYPDNREVLKQLKLPMVGGAPRSASRQEHESDYSGRVHHHKNELYE